MRLQNVFTITLPTTGAIQTLACNSNPNPPSIYQNGRHTTTLWRGLGKHGNAIGSPDLYLASNALLRYTDQQL